MVRIYLQPTTAVLFAADYRVIGFRICFAFRNWDWGSTVWLWPQGTFILQRKYVRLSQESVGD